MQEMQETNVQLLSWEDALKEKMATYSGKSQDTEAWRATVHEIAESRIWLSN